MTTPQILVVEDEAIVAANIEMRLQHLGYTVPAIVDTGEEAIEEVARLHPSLVLMDIRLAGEIDGITAAARIRSEHAIPVIYLTAYTDDETVQRARVTEPYGYILKPFELSELRTAIELALYRHAMERQSKAREHWFATVLRAIGDAVLVTDERPAITFLNPAAEALTGWAQAAAAGRPVDDVLKLVDSLTRAPIENPALAALREERSVSVCSENAVLVRPDREIPVGDYAAPIYDARGTLLGAVVMLRDLSERRAMEHALRASEERLRALIASLPVVLIVTDREGAIVLTEGRGLAALDIPPGENLADTIFELCAPGSDPAALMQTLSEQGEVSWSGMFRERFFEVRLTSMRDARGETAGMIVVGIDVTARRDAEERYRLIESAVQHADEMMVIAGAGDDPAGPRILFVNNSFTRVTGYAPDEVLGKPLTALQSLPANAAVMARMAQAIARELPFQGEALGERKDGSQLSVEWNVVPLRDAAGGVTHWLAILRDITQRKREQEIGWQRQKLESLGVLASGIAHDFNNLLAVVLGNASLALLDLPPDSPVRELITPIELAARRAADLTRQMMAYAGKDRLVAHALDINALVGETLALMGGDIPPQIQVRLNLDPQLPALIADAAQIRRVIKNLVTNAYEAIGDGAGTLTVTTGLRDVSREYIRGTYLAPDLPDGTYLAIEIADTGIGMEPEVRARIFEPFFTTKFAGRGLGLAEVLGIISAHQGTIQVESAPGGGTTCTLLFPLSPLSESSRTEALEMPFSQQRGLLLVIDDDQAVREQASRILDRAGFSVLLAPDAQTGVDLFRSYSSAIACVVLDATLPQPGSADTLARIRKVRPDARVVLITSPSAQAPSDLPAADLAGALSRPFTPDELRSRVERALAEPAG